MTKEEILDFYDNNWNDHNTVYNMLDKIIDNYEDKIKMLSKNIQSENTQTTDDEEIKRLKSLLLECQDRLDEETHSLKNLKL